MQTIVFFPKGTQNILYNYYIFAIAESHILTRWNTLFLQCCNLWKLTKSTPFVVLCTLFEIDPVQFIKCRCHYKHVQRQGRGRKESEHWQYCITPEPSKCQNTINERDLGGVCDGTITLLQRDNLLMSQKLKNTCY